MTNRERYYKRGEIMISDSGAAIYYRPAHSSGLFLITILFKEKDKTIWETINNWLDEENNNPYMYYYDDLDTFKSNIILLREEN